jgi:protein-S-isoprenylcysteine O-methyltransferase Ste14
VLAGLNSAAALEKKRAINNKYQRNRIDNRPFSASMFLYRPAFRSPECDIMDESNPVLKSILVTTFFALVVVGLVPCLLLQPARFDGYVEWNFFHVTAIVVFITGAAISLTCVKDFLFKAKGTPAPFDPPKNLVVDGLYRYVRNPMYRGLFLVIFAEALFFSSVLLVVYLLMLIAFFHAFVRFYEEPRLARKYGRSYTQYCSRVNRWIPKPHPKSTG